MKKQDTYIVINESFNNLYTYVLTKEELIKKLTPEFGDEFGYFGDVNIKSSINEEFDDYKNGTLTIIKGEIIVPTTKEVVMSYEIK